MSSKVAHTDTNPTVATSNKSDPALIGKFVYFMPSHPGAYLYGSHGAILGCQHIASIVLESLHVMRPDRQRPWPGRSPWKVMTCPLDAESHVSLPGKVYCCLDILRTRSIDHVRRVAFVQTWSIRRADGARIVIVVDRDRIFGMPVCVVPARLQRGARCVVVELRRGMTDCARRAGSDQAAADGPVQGLPFRGRRPVCVAWSTFARLDGV